MGAKMFFRAITPPFIWEGAHTIKDRLRPPPIPITEIHFPTWAAACAACASYKDAALTQFRFERFLLNKAAGNLPEITSQPLYWLARILGSNISVTDFGGSFGEYGAVIAKEFPGLAYTVVENDALVKVAASSSPVILTTAMPQACDIFFTSGTLQYLDDPYAIAESGFRSAAKAVILARNCFSETEMFRVQKSHLFDNGGGETPLGFENTDIFYPIRTINEKKIDAIAKSAGFSLLARTAEPAAAHYPSVYSRHLIYLRPCLL